MHPPRILGILAATALLATGCTPSLGPTPVPVTPVPTCTPEFGGDPVACTPADHERMQQIDRRYAEAERVFREVTRLEDDTLRGALTTVTPALEALYDPAGPYLEFRRKYVTAIGTEGLTSFEGNTEVRGISRRPVPGDSLATLALSVCVDGRQTVSVFSDGMREPGRLQGLSIEFTQTDGPRIWSTTADEEIRCE